MASTSLSPSLTHFIGSKVIIGRELPSRPISVKFRPFRVSAAAATCESSTAERSRSSTYNTPRHISLPASLYEVLGIQIGATCQEIKSAYRRLARVLHPDVAAATRQNNDDDNTAFEFMKVHEAYETLSDPEKRQDYDLSLFRLQRRPVSSPFTMSTSSATAASGFPGYTRRSWETDQCW
ncbi:hypothetical protein Ddye_007267 [Dipteronia dyeriana]|uniref:J domain-containing protein n=1 Tax=Dipteronia dyeriana TaxID=168575 RepID=A0AAD9XJL5_9ROSI|nr:hypothetical protein Ddye_007267 [Dipteronia dyeriana]